MDPGGRGARVPGAPPPLDPPMKYDDFEFCKFVEALYLKTDRIMLLIECLQVTESL